MEWQARGREALILGGQGGGGRLARGHQFNPQVIPLRTRLLLHTSTHTHTRIFLVHPSEVSRLYETDFHTEILQNSHIGILVQNLVQAEYCLTLYPIQFHEFSSYELSLDGFLFHLIYVCFFFFASHCNTASHIQIIRHVMT